MIQEQARRKGITYGEHWPMETGRARERRGDGEIGKDRDPGQRWANDECAAFGVFVRRLPHFPACPISTSPHPPSALPLAIEEHHQASHQLGHEAKVQLIESVRRRVVVGITVECGICDHYGLETTIPE